MTPRFLAFIPFILEWEGSEYENDPDDPGGETKFGIDKRSHPGVDIKHLTEEGATAIYFGEWLKGGYEHMDPALGEARFNTAVNAGIGQDHANEARMELQKEIEKWTIDLPGMESSVYIDEQENFYRRLVAQKPNFGKYLHGWLNRLVALRERLGLPPRAEVV